MLSIFGGIVLPLSAGSICTARFARSNAESSLVKALRGDATGDESLVDTVDDEDALGDIGTKGRFIAGGKTGLERSDEEGVNKPESSLPSTRARRLGIERFLVRGRASGDESLLLSVTFGDLEPATGVTSPFPDSASGVRSLSSCSRVAPPAVMAWANEYHESVWPFQLLRRSCAGGLGGESVAKPPPKTAISSLLGIVVGDVTMVGSGTGSWSRSGEVGGEGAQ